jgi:outer membrane protein assembly factor BamD (BamD/ComL family)
MLRPAVVLLALALAPYQCGSKPDPQKRIEDDPAQVLYELAQRFHERGDRAGEEATLQFLAEKYPSSRFGKRAKDDLEALRARPK